jgi:hypothetical protein
LQMIIKNKKCGIFAAVEEYKLSEEQFGPVY